MRMALSSALVFGLALFSVMSHAADIETLQIRIHGKGDTQPTLIYLPGLHGDWTLVSSFRHEITNHVRFVEFTYPRNTQWSLQDYARAVETALLQHRITNGWILAESFGSQVGWTFLHEQSRKCSFQMDGLVLAGGFVKHPNAPGIFLAKQFTQQTPNFIFKACLGMYARYATFRHRHAPETLASVKEFVERRTPADRRAMTHRLNLIARADLREVARAANVPVFALAGFWDPIVPRVSTRRWLKRHCPSFKDAQVIGAADHNVLGTAPKQSAEIILGWMKR